MRRITAQEFYQRANGRMDLETYLSVSEDIARSGGDLMAPESMTELKALLVMLGKAIEDKKYWETTTPTTRRSVDEIFINLEMATRKISSLKAACLTGWGRLMPSPTMH